MGPGHRGLLSRQGEAIGVGYRRGCRNFRAHSRDWEPWAARLGALGGMCPTGRVWDRLDPCCRTCAGSGPSRHAASRTAPYDQMVLRAAVRVCDCITVPSLLRHHLTSMPRADGTPSYRPLPLPSQTQAIHFCPVPYIPYSAPALQAPTSLLTSIVAHRIITTPRARHGRRRALAVLRSRLVPRINLIPFIPHACTQPHAHRRTAPCRPNAATAPSRGRSLAY